VMMHCHAGCSFEEIARALGVNLGDLSYQESALDVSEEPPGVRTAYKLLSYRERAKELYRADKYKDIQANLSVEHSWVDLSERPLNKVRYAIEDLAQSGANIMLSADRKTGKTRFALNLCKAACDEQPFLNYFPVNLPADKRILYMNYEMDENSFFEWTHQTNIENKERLSILNLKGSVLPFWDDAYRARFVEHLAAGAFWLVIFDTQLAAASGMLTTENDSMEWARFQAAVDQVKALAGVDCTLFLHHMGKGDKDHARGSSRIEDWPDSIWYLSGVENNSTDRKFKAEGRNVAFSETQLVYDVETGVYKYVGLTRREAVEERQRLRLLRFVLDYHAADLHWPLYKKVLSDSGLSRDKCRGLIDSLVGSGVLTRPVDRSIPGSTGGKPPTRLELTGLGYDMLGLAHVEEG